MNGSTRPPIVITKFFKERNLTELSLEDIEKNLVKAIIQDPELADSSNISVTIDDNGSFKDNLLHIIGKVKSKEDFDRVQEIVEKNTREEMKISNELIVG